MLCPRMEQNKNGTDLCYTLVALSYHSEAAGGLLMGEICYTGTSVTLAASAAVALCSLAALSIAL